MSENRCSQLKQRVINDTTTGFKSEPQNRRISNNEFRMMVSLVQRRRLRRVALNLFLKMAEFINFSHFEL